MALSLWRRSLLFDIGEVEESNTTDETNSSLFANFTINFAPDNNVPFNSTIDIKTSPCLTWQQPQHVLFQLANIFFCISYLAPNGTYGILFMHGLLIIGFLVFSTWAWNIICAPDVFIWNFCFMLLNMGQALYLLYTLRQIKLPPELEDVYLTMFQPLQVSRLLFKKLVSLEYGQVLSLHAGEAYAMQNLTRTDRLGLLLSGKVNVITDHHFLHHIHPKEFLDSPEFESSKSGGDDKFKVSIIAATSCRYIFWQRQNLEYLLIKETYLASVLSVLLARDITTKLYAMNNKIITEKGSHLDIRLPSITSSITSHATQDGQDSQTPFRSMRSKSSHCNSLSHNSYGHIPMVYPYQGIYRENEGMDSVFGSKEHLVPVPVINEMPKKKCPSDEELEE
ncbi:popeye domain-containing protein 3-like [Centruroides vittatus]|uniref:popeye domain-containing protein 3-like n=1 Tax=Centruroides vittatus TaxID=120091 RepID=UPI00350EFBE2